MTDDPILSAIERLSGYHSLFIPEFSYGELRIDVAVVDFKHRWVRGFEIKRSRSDFLRDIKWTEYTKFLSSLTIVCPPGIISPEEIVAPFGLLWVDDKSCIFWKKRPRNFQDRKSLAWFWTYISVIEKELPRLKWELEEARRDTAEKGIKGIFEEISEMRK
jgi:hypothetical protein